MNEDPADTPRDVAIETGFNDRGEPRSRIIEDWLEQLEGIRPGDKEFMDAYAYDLDPDSITPELDKRYEEAWRRKENSELKRELPWVIPLVLAHGEVLIQELSERPYNNQVTHNTSDLVLQLHDAIRRGNLAALYIVLRIQFEAAAEVARKIDPLTHSPQNALPEPGDPREDVADIPMISLRTKQLEARDALRPIWDGIRRSFVIIGSQYLGLEPKKDTFTGNDFPEKFPTWQTILGYPGVVVNPRNQLAQSNTDIKT